ncbi:UDP-N-acetylmuramoyl-tripeptide--D-alanyl-D-alanine ligase [Wohlfahrtiimonas chitiniclastica]|uniref:UDP-N-acetylmuramoyl-tripeptide--D-alanyl-D- alanine ligase n=1 Tax=Wohlfahrtiimonas chitiniclastica TaxID=400946 RepID=UPI0007B4015C|nr:UDP-N-acetylmuramoyl-tripeptide--D-alanyl-D-alanine ligase [Wohlfahrtiimonas chitiniclastica]KZS22806.1 UDP-N-acetylmuramoyl-tripeptide--D-alanyl-D- alanine ligase [Wohlfahrtiimonas chitiniclastica]MBS7815169.1 UDP-N-acetylmuramoyl-tripeptide--D-alanyl-D-alanine ligase [Wohlfahrtiimonas chitiniclastica]WHR55254.1 UDP-N-acetylmuramoyl-tripeptide--D-alanyl-D-alanine ligase [Wohlfahrtiimonas chitiniclastica]
MKLSQAAQILQGELKGMDAIFYGASTDTRLIQAGQLFFAWKGDKHDAHNFLDSIEAKGAIGAVVERYTPSVNISQIVVKDSQKALGILAKAWMADWQGTTVALTGSNGKTTLKEMIASILRGKGATLATEGNYNNHVGCPLTILKLTDQYEYAVLEMGANHFEEIRYLTHIACPDVAILNNAGPCHLEGFGSIEGVARAKGEIFEGLKAGGTAIINADDDYADYWQSLNTEHRVLTFGIRNTADVMAKNISGQSFDLVIHGQSIRVTLALVGIHNILNACAAAAATYALGASLDEIKTGLENLHCVKGRLEKIQLSDHHILLNDAYNGNPASLRAGIDALEGIADHTWLVLGDMRELGTQAVQMHEECGRYAKVRGFDQLLALGEMAAKSAEAFGEGGQVYADHDAIIDHINQTLATLKDESVAILVKGSNSMKMYLIAEAMVQKEKEV